MKPKTLFPVLCFVLVLTFISGCETEDLIIAPDEEYFYDRNAIKSGDDGSIIYYANELFVREAGKPVLVTRKIGGPELANFADCLKLHVKSGANGSDFVSSAILKIDEIVLLNSSDFTNSDQEFTIDLCNLTESSILELVIYGTPGSVLEIWIDGTLKYDLDQGLVGFYDFDGNANDKTLFGGNPYLTSNIIFGITDNITYCSFTPTSLIFIPQNEALNFENSSGVTIIARIKEDKYQNGQILGKRGYGGSEDDEYCLVLTDEGKVYGGFVSPYTYTEVTSNNSISTGIWQTIALTWEKENQNICIYLNGEIDTIVHSNVVSVNKTNTDLTIGRPLQDYLTSFEGSIDFIKFYNRKLSDIEIVAISNL